MNKQVLEIDGGKNEKLEKERAKIDVYQSLYASFKTLNKSKKTTLAVKVIGLKNNLNISNDKPEVKICAVCELGDSGWQIIVPAGYMGFAKSEFPDNMTPMDKVSKYRAYIKKMVGATIDVVIVAIDLKSMVAAGNRELAMKDKIKRNYFTYDKNGLSKIERAFKNGKPAQARVVTIAKSVVILDVFGYITPVIARNVEWRFIENLKDVLSVGDIVPVKIMTLELDKDNEEILECYVSIKDAKENMMKRNMARFTENSSYAGKVTGINNGYYVQIGDFENGIDVLCKIVHSYENPNLGDTVLVTIGIKDEAIGKVYGRIDEILSKNSRVA